MNYGFKCGSECLFNFSHDYSINDLALLYGIAYNLPTKKQNSRLFRLLTGVEAGGRHNIAHWRGNLGPPGHRLSPGHWAGL